MKLYTEREVRSIIRSMGRFTDEQVDYYVEELTPIELPSDEEIEIRSAQKAMIENPLIQGICKHYFNLGAVHVRDKIQGGNK